MKKISLLIIISVLISFGFIARTEISAYKTVSQDSRVEWKAWHLGGVGERFGKVTIKSGEVYTKDNLIYSGNFFLDIENLTVENFKESGSKNDKLEENLKSSDFFDTDSFPTALFQITDVTAIQGDFNTLLGGNLKIKNVNKNIKIKVNYIQTKNGIELNSKTFEIDRRDWELTYNTKGTSGIAANYIIANEIAFKVNLKMSK